MLDAPRWALEAHHRAARRAREAREGHGLLEAEASFDRTGNSVELNERVVSCDTRFHRAFDRATQKSPESECGLVSKEELMNETGLHFRRACSGEMINIASKAITAFG